MVLGVAVLFLLAGGLLAALLYSGGGRASAVRFVAKPRGTLAVAFDLKKAEIISSTFLFRLGVFLIPGRGLRGGEYRIKSDDSIANIIAAMRRGKSVRYKQTIPEGLTNYQIKEELRLNTLLTGEIGIMPEEGTLLPETYFVYRDQKRSAVVRHMNKAHKILVARLWEARDPNLPLSNPTEAVVLASIVERETGIVAERAHIAGVFINRLNRSNYMQLQSDPTVIYALTRGKPFKRALTYDDLKLDSPYNTYANYGLPPGAIANPGRAALEAVMKPAKTKDMFFVADGTGGHAFAATYEEHLQNVAKWREVQKARRTAPEMAADTSADVEGPTTDILAIDTPSIEEMSVSENEQKPPEALEGDQADSPSKEEQAP